MSYLTVYLYSADEQALLDALAPLLGTDEDGNILTASHDHHLDYPIALHQYTGESYVDEEGAVQYVTEPKPGYHGNLRTKRQDIVDALTGAGLVITPASPSRVFA